MVGSPDSPAKEEETLDRLPYAPFYCEENVWHLCGHARLQHCRDRKVLFVSNAQRACALWRQRACRHVDEPVVWDYHVVLIAGEPGQWEVWDQDSLLPCPSPLVRYLEQTFLPLPPRLKRFAPRFRLIDGATYRAELSSDRSHMLAADGSWRHPPPKWPPIVREGEPSFLRWTVMDEGDLGVKGLEELAKRLS